MVTEKKLPQGRFDKVGGGVVHSRWPIFFYQKIDPKRYFATVGQRLVKITKRFLPKRRKEYLDIFESPCYRDPFVCQLV